MTELEKARQEIDGIDAEMAALFERRMDAVVRVAREKAAEGASYYDAAREEAVLERNTGALRDAEKAPFYRDFLRAEMRIARHYQDYETGKNKVGYQGVQGAFAHIALKHLFPYSEAVNYASWGEVFDAVEQGDIAYGVLPFENSNAGDVSAVLDLCYLHESVNVVEMYDLPISQNLLVVPGTALQEVKKVISHPQAISQSERFLKGNALAAEPCANTALAAQLVAEKGDKSLAAIASSETAAIYGLEVLVQNINTDGDNTTRFIVISRGQPSSGDRFSLLFTADNKPGTLGRIIQVIGEAGFNMESIKSRPRPGVKFQYYFYTELVGSPYSGTGRDLLEKLRDACQTVRLLGAFNRE